MPSDDVDLSRRRALELLGAGTLGLLSGTAGAGTQCSSPREAPEFASLAQSVRGQVLPRGASAFESTKQSLIWNPVLPSGRSPDAIVRAVSEADVAAAIRFANAHDLKVAMRSAGHNYHGSSLQSGGLLVDVGQLRTLEVDARARRVSIGPGVKGGELMARLAPLGLAFPVGHCSDVGLGGYLLGGGLGWNYGAWGAATMSVVGVQMVTASGESVYADASRNADLFWAARGAGRGFFGAVTRFDVALYDLPRAIRALSLAFPMDCAHAVAQWLDRALATVHRNVEVICYLTPPDGSNPPLIAILAFSMADTPSVASARFGKLREPPAAIPLVGQGDEHDSTFAEILKGADEGFPSGRRMAGDMRYSNASLTDLIASTQQLARHGPAAPSGIMFALLGQRALPPRPVDCAFSMEGQVDFGAYAFWDDPSQDAANREWIRAAVRGVEPHASGGYISETDLSAGPMVVRQCFSGEAWKKLAALRREHDPAGRFFGYEC